MNWQIWRKAISPLDFIIFIVGIYLFAHMNYNELRFIDKAFAVCYVLWLVMLVVKARIVFKRMGENPPTD